MRRFLKHNGLSLGFAAIFLLALGFQALTGWQEFNNNEVAHAELVHERADTISFGRYLTSSEFGQAVMENWQSEYLQFTLYILATVWLLQRGSPESKKLGKAGLESDQDQKVGEHAERNSPRWAKVGGLRTFVYSNSLLLVMTGIFLGSWFASLRDRVDGVQQPAGRARAAGAVMGRLPRLGGLLADDAAELAVGVPRRGLDGDPECLPAPAWLTGIQAGRRPA